MWIDRAESNSRDLIEAIHERIPVKTVGAEDVIREQALAMLAKELDAKLANLQEGETVQVTFRVDIIKVDGTVRGGRERDRNMPEYIEWRKQVYIRDNYTCQACGASGMGNLNAHHIKQWAHHPDVRFDIANGVTLCDDCHAKQHPHLNFMRHHGTPA